MVITATGSRLQKSRHRDRKTASGVFGKNPNKHTYQLGPEALKVCREKWPTATTIASGEYVGPNLYGFVFNSPVNAVDRRGLTVTWKNNPTALVIYFEPTETKHGYGEIGLASAVPRGLTPDILAATGVVWTTSVCCSKKSGSFRAA